MILQFKYELEKRPLFFISLFLLVINIIYVILNPITFRGTNEENITIKGVIINIEYRENGKTLIIKCNKEYREGFGKNTRVYVDENNINNIGDRVSINGKFSLNREPENPGEFNKLIYYGIKGEKGYIIPKSINKISYNYGYLLKKHLNKVKLYIRESIINTYNEKTKGIILTLLIGDKSNLDIDTRELYSNNGLMHILAISGLHLNFISDIVYKLLLKIKGLKNKYRIGITIGILYIYVLMCGMSASQTRSLIMISLNYIGKLTGRSSDTLTLLGLSYIILGLNNPYIILDIGFILSFMCIFLIRHIIPSLKVGKIKSSILFQLGILPFIVYNYYTYPLYSIIVNFLILPWFGLVFAFAFVNVLFYYLNPYLVYVLKVIIEKTFNLYEYICKLFLGINGSLLFIGRKSIFLWILYGVIYGILLIFIYKKSFHTKQNKDLYKYINKR